MFFEKWVKSKNQETMPPMLTKAIEDAVLLGDVKELDDVLELIAYDEDFPATIRYDLEALRCFRAWYGPGRELEPKVPLQKQKVVIMETAWCAELLDRVRQTGKIVALHGA